MAIDGPKGPRGPDDPDDPDDPDGPGDRDKPERPERPFSAVPDRPIRSALDIEREQPFGPRRQYTLPEPRSDSPDTAPEARAKAIREIISDDSGRIVGIEDSRGVRLLSTDELTGLRHGFHRRLGNPDQVVDRGKGIVEVWYVTADPPSRVTYRTFSGSGGPTVDIHRVPGIDDVKRFHVRQEEDR